ncbi:hypothetical protein [Asanoa sp. NPDC050611]|uniref:hypothetical protein n=1 Tax=Asanoa sp. NPDC050611 TaxID=3157098 RepID=UPI0033F0988D
MSKKIVGKVLASLALGGVTLLIAPGVAMADPSDAAQWAGKDDKASSHCAPSEWHGKKDEGDKGDKGDREDKGDKGDKREEAVKRDEGDKKDGDKKDCDPPKGWVDGGAAGVSTDATLATTGGVLVGAAALGGLVLLRRRRTDGSVA